MVIRVVGVVLVLAAVPARAEEAVMLIQAGMGVTAADAAKTMEKWRTQARAVEGLVEFAPGYPRIVTKRDFPELDEGEHYVLLGLCRPGEIEVAPRVLEALQLSVGTQSVEHPRGAWSCPTLRAGWIPGASADRIDDNHALRAMIFDRQSAGGSETMVHVVLLGFGRGLLDHKLLRFAPGCTPKLRFDEATLLIDKTCGEAKETLAFAQVGDKIEPAAGLETMADVQAVVWGGGKTEAEAQAALAEWAAEKAALGTAATLAPGYPRIVASEELPGLNPGYKVVVAAVCPGARLKEPMRILKAFRPGLYAKAVKVKGLPGCPTIPQHEKLMTVKRKRVGRLELTVMKMGDPSQIPWTGRALLRNRNGVGALVDWRETGSSQAEPSGTGACFKSEVVSRGDGLGFDMTCGAGVGGGELATWPLKLTYRVVKGRLAEKLTKGKITQPDFVGE